MEQWFSELATFEKVYWIVAAVSSVIFIILLVLTLIGGDIEDVGDVDTEIEGDSGIGFQFLSFKNLMGFFTIFGWSGIACIEEGMSLGLTILISIVCGLIMMFAMAALFYYLSKLTSSGTLKLTNAVDAIGEVYLTIGANRSKMGKVQITIQGGLRELEAITDEANDLVMGNMIKVKEVTNNGILIVEQLKN